MKYTFDELWRDVATCESNWTKIQHSADELGHGGVGVRAVEVGSMEAVVRMEMHKLQLENDAILTRVFEQDGVDTLRAHCEAETGDILTMKYLRQIRGRFCKHRKCSIEEANQQTVKEFASMLEFEVSGSGAIPPDITDSLTRFRVDYPDVNKVAFLMMQFSNSAAIDEIVTQIRETFAEFEITVVRADDKEYHDDLLPNIKTYMHGCGLGIGLFERIDDEYFNPNMSLEIGYMMAMGKPVCLLKDKTLKSLNTDLVGRLYKSFDTRSPTTTIPLVIRQWLSDRGFVGLSSFFKWAAGRWRLTFRGDRHEDLTISADGKYLTSKGVEREITVLEYEPGKRVVFKKKKGRGQWQKEVLDIRSKGDVMEGCVEDGHQLRYERAND